MFAGHCAQFKSFLCSSLFKHTGQDSGSSTGETQTKGGGAKTRGKRKESTEDETEGGVAKARGKRKKKDSPVEEKGEESEGGVAKGRSKKRAVKEEEGSSSAGASDATDGI